MGRWPPYRLHPIPTSPRRMAIRTSAMVHRLFRSAAAKRGFNDIKLYIGNYDYSEFHLQTLAAQAASVHYCQEQTPCLAKHDGLSRVGRSRQSPRSERSRARSSPIGS